MPSWRARWASLEKFAIDRNEETSDVQVHLGRTVWPFLREGSTGLCNVVQGKLKIGAQMSPGPDHTQLLKCGHSRTDKQVLAAGK